MSKNRSRRGSKKALVLEHEFEAAKRFIQSDPIGKRLQAAEHILTLLMKEEFPRVKRFIFDASFDLREIISHKKFERALHSNPTMTELMGASKTGGYVRIHLEKDCIHFVLFYEDQINANEAALFSDAFGKIIAATYASLGLDMSGCHFESKLKNFISEIKGKQI